MTTLLRPMTILALVLIPSIGSPPLQTAVLRGRITDQSGCPVAGVLMTITSEQGAIITRTKTEADGTYRFEHVPTGPAIVSATLIGFEPAEARIAVFRGNNFWDSNIYLNFIEGMGRHRVSGTISAPDGTTVAEATVTLINAVNGERMDQVRSDMGGKYSFRVRGGDYIVAVSAVGRGAAATFVAFAEEGNSSKTLDFTLKARSSCAPHGA